MSARLLLAIESTCDETAAAVIRFDLRVMSSVVSSQDDLHARFGGVVPEIAARAHVERILPVIEEALSRAHVALSEIDAVAVATTPGLAGSLLVGLVAAKSLSLATGKPLIAVDHLQAHIFACRMEAERNIFPCVGLIVSGGHSNLYHCAGPCDFELLGGTIDDAAGEAFDKVASMLGLPYPGGPHIGRVATDGDPQAHRFPRPMLRDREGCDFSFSGLKTAVRYEIAGPGQPDISASHLTPQQIADIAASFQEAVVDCIVGKALLAIERTGLRRLCVGGGVAANARLRERLADESSRRDIELHIAPPRLCTDNAVMGAIAIERYHAGLFESLDLDAQPGLVRASRH